MEAGLCLLRCDSSVDLQTWAPALPSYNHPFPRSVSPCRFQRMCLTLGAYRAILKKSRRPTGRLFCWEQSAGSLVPVPHQRSHPCHRTLETVVWLLDREQMVHGHTAAGSAAFVPEPREWSRLLDGASANWAEGERVEGAGDQGVGLHGRQDHRLSCGQSRNAGKRSLNSWVLSCPGVPPRGNHCRSPLSVAWPSVG